ncbi:MAG: hypothetical protein NVS4B11_22800 [Ktedonobacteraceae bacterium]
MESEKPNEETNVAQERLNWQVAWRDDVKVAQASIDEGHSMTH